MIRYCRILSLAGCLVLGGAVAGLADMHEGMEEHDGPPPMLVLMPPPDVEKPEGVEISEDPEEAFQQIFDVFFEMMDHDGNGELAHGELAGWVHPPPHMGEHMEGEHMEGGDGELMEKIRMLEDELHHIHMERREHAIMELNEHRDHIEEELAHMREEHARMAEHMQEMEEEAKRVAEELERIHSEPMDEPPMDEPPE
jgi:hypothetical protein